MKRFLLAYICLCVACPFAISQQTCHSYEYVQRLIQSDPKLAKRLQDKESAEANSLSREVISSINTGAHSVSPIIRIPVVVHILYNNALQNISDEQVYSQIEALNRDFRRLNDDSSKTPAGYRSRAADCRFEFILANVDPQGFVTTGILRKKTSIQYFGLDDRIKQSAIGGDDPWDSNNYLNIWVGSLAGALYGYASPVYGPREKDGVVVSYVVFGTTGTVGPPFNKGRIAVHEVGHWLGLRHIWGDRHCGDDYVEDTPPQQTSSFGCVTGTPVSCGNAPFGNMYMNYMDLTADPCTNMFTNGQKNKMRRLFESGEYREALLSSKGADGNGLPLPVAAPIDTAEAIVGLYPNPVQSTLIIDIVSNEELIGKTVSVFNQFGQLVLKDRITRQILRMNMIPLKEGMYFVRIDGNKKTYKIVKAGSAD
jgi:hypothetical protein